MKKKRKLDIHIWRMPNGFWTFKIVGISSSQPKEYMEKHLAYYAAGILSTRIFQEQGNRGSDVHFHNFAPK